MQLGNVMTIIHAVYSLLVVDLARLINRLQRIISDPYTRNHYRSCLYGDKGYIVGPLKRELTDKSV